jgi:hypothetical protein
MFVTNWRTWFLLFGWLPIANRRRSFSVVVCYLDQVLRFMLFFFSLFVLLGLLTSESEKLASNACHDKRGAGRQAWL